MFVAENKKWFRGHKLMPCIHPDTRFRNGSRGATQWHETTTNMSFGPKEVDWACSLRKNMKWFQGHKLMPCIHPDTCFRNGSRAATKWRETTPKLSFGPKEVDWACSLRKKHEMDPRAQTHALCPHRYSFSQWVTCGIEMARNHPKPVFWT